MLRQSPGFGGVGGRERRATASTKHKRISPLLKRA